MQQERPPPYWRGTEQAVVVVLGHARDKLLPAHKSGLGFPRLERPGEVFVDRQLIIRKLVHAAKAEGFWQEAPDIGEIGRAHVRTPVTNAHLVCRLLIEKQTEDSHPVPSHNIARVRSNA